MNGNTLNAKQLTIRLITLGLALMLLLSTTGCSVIMGIFEPEETVTTDSEGTDTAARTLLPTPAAPSVDVQPTATSAESSEPTPTAEVNEANTAPVVEAPAAIQTTLRLVTITGPTVNLRSQPSTDSEILVTVPNGTTFEMTDQNSTGDWYQICCVNNSTAWVYSELASVEEKVVSVVPTASAVTVDAQSAPSADEQTQSSATDQQAIVLDIPLVAPVFTQSAVSDGTRYEYSEQGFALTLPNGWQPIDLSAERLAASLSNLANENAQAAALLEEQLKTVVNARFTFYAAEATPHVLDTGFATNVSLLRQPLPPGISLEFYSQIMAKQVQERFALLSPVSITPGSVPAGKSVTLNYTMSGPHNGLAIVEYLIMQGQTVYDLKFTTTAEQSDVYVANFAMIAESFKLLDK